jgi:hypothetical protein
MSAAYQDIVPTPSAFDRATETFAALKMHMRAAEAMQMTHGELESHVIEKTRTIARDILQGHLDLRTGAERPVRVIGADGVQRGQRRASSRQLRTLVGDVVLERLLYQAVGVDGLAPQDAALSLAQDSYSMGVRRRVAEEVADGSFDAAVETLGRTSGATIAKRQVERLARASVADFEEFYRCLKWKPEDADQLLVLTVDGAGIIMRTESLRPQTRALAERDAEEPKVWPDRTKSGEKPNRRRVAEVASVYSVAPFVRSSDDVIGELASIRLIREAGEGKPSRPRPVNKRVWASIDKSMSDVVEQTFQEALRRDPEHRRRWVVLVDGQCQQLAAVNAAAQRHGVTVTILCDFIHALEYLWKAAHCFHAPGSSEARRWVCERARALLEGADASQVAAGMRRSATLRKLANRKAVDKAARYLIKRRHYMRYGDALGRGLPIATGVIEGACRHLIRDRLDCCGARWSVIGAEAVLQLRALRLSGDFDEYWAFHLAREHERNHRSNYSDDIVPEPIPKPRLRLVKK